MSNKPTRRLTYRRPPPTLEAQWCFIITLTAVAVIVGSLITLGAWLAP